MLTRVPLRSLTNLGFSIELEFRNVIEKNPGKLRRTESSKQGETKAVNDGELQI